jgi:hypothetical protein
MKTYKTLVQIIFTICLLTYHAYADENLQFQELFNCTEEQEVTFHHFSQSLKTLAQKQEFKKLITMINPDTSQQISISMIWFSGYYKKLDKPIIIGESKIGIAFYYNLLAALECMKHLIKNGYIQFYIDNETYFSNKNQLDWILSHYPNFKLYFLEDQLNILDYAINHTQLKYIPNKHNFSLFNYINYLATNTQYEDIKSIKNLLDHGKEGNPAIASDTLRMIQLDPENLSLYIDIDEFCLWNEKEKDKLWNSIKFIAYQKLNSSSLYHHLQNLSHLFSYLELSNAYEKPTFAFPFHKIHIETTNSKIISYFLTETQTIEIKNTFITHVKTYLANLDIYKTFQEKYHKTLYSEQVIYFTPMFAIMNSTGPSFFCTPFSWCRALTKEKFPYVKADEQLEINTDISGTLSWGSLPVYFFSQHVENFNHHRPRFQPYLKLSYLLTIYDFQRRNKNRFSDNLRLIEQDIYEWFELNLVLNPLEAKIALEWIQACYQTTYYDEFKNIEKIFKTAGS